MEKELFNDMIACSEPAKEATLMFLAEQFQQVDQEWLQKIHLTPPPSSPPEQWSEREWNREIHRLYWLSAEEWVRRKFRFSFQQYSDTR
jgi:hypothetical protein